MWPASPPCPGGRPVLIAQGFPKAAPYTTQVTQQDWLKARTATQENSLAADWHPFALSKVKQGHEPKPHHRRHEWVKTDKAHLLVGAMAPTTHSDMLGPTSRMALPSLGPRCGPDQWARPRRCERKIEGKHRQRDLPGHSGARLLLPAKQNRRKPLLPHPPPVCQ